MTGPLVALAGATVVVGFLGAAPILHAPFFKWVFFEEPEKITFVPWIALVGTIAALGGIYLALVTYRERTATDPLQPALGPMWNVLQNRFLRASAQARLRLRPVASSWSSRGSARSSSPRATRASISSGMKGAPSGSRAQSRGASSTRG